MVRYLGILGNIPWLRFRTLVIAFIAKCPALQVVTLIKTNKPLIITNKSRQKVLSCLFLECSHVAYTKTIMNAYTFVNVNNTCAHFLSPFFCSSPPAHTPPPELVRTGQMAAPGTTLCPSPCDSWVYISYHGPTRPLGKLHTKDGWTLDAGWQVVVKGTCRVHSGI